MRVWWSVRRSGIGGCTEEEGRRVEENCRCAAAPKGWTSQSQSHSHWGFGFELFILLLTLLIACGSFFCLGLAKAAR